MDDGWGDRPDDYPWETAYQALHRDMQERAAAQSRSAGLLIWFAVLGLIAIVGTLIWWFA